MVKETVAEFLNRNPQKLTRVPYVGDYFRVGSLTTTRRGSSRRGGEIARKFLGEEVRPALSALASVKTM